MFTSLLVLLPLILVGSAEFILLTNDDGWAVAQIRAQFNAFEASGYVVRVFRIQIRVFVLLTHSALVPF